MSGTSPMSTSASPMNRWGGSVPIGVGGPQGNMPTTGPQYIGGGRPQGLNSGGTDVTPFGPGAQRPSTPMAGGLTGAGAGGSGGGAQPYGLPPPPSGAQGNNPTWVPQHIGGTPTGPLGMPNMNPSAFSNPNQGIPALSGFSGLAGK